MKGREAVRAARRRQAAAQTTTTTVQEELRQEREGRRLQVLALEAEIRRLHSEHRAEAERMAKKELERRLAEVEEQRRKRGLSDELVGFLAWRKDHFMMNACRYISMTRGIPPSTALEQVLTWSLDRSVDWGYQPTDDFLLTQLGVPLRGWVSRTIRRTKLWGKKGAKHFAGSGEALGFISLDEALDRDHPDIHPDYKPHWYPRSAEYFDVLNKKVGVEGDEGEAQPQD